MKHAPALPAIRRENAGASVGVCPLGALPAAVGCRLRRGQPRRDDVDPSDLSDDAVGHVLDSSTKNPRAG